MRCLVHALLAWLFASAALAQDDFAAGLFAEARQLPLVEQGLSVEVTSEQAVLHLSQVYVNDGAALAQADFRLPLPQGAILTRFGFEKHGEMLWATLERKEQADADHRAAAAEGRTTGLASQKEGVLSFSVYPLQSRERKRIELELRVPVVHEMGQGRVRLPLDAFAGRNAPETPVLANLLPDGPLVEWGVEDAEIQTVGSEGQSVLLAFSVTGPVELWWREDGPPLSMRARAVPLEDGLGIAFEVSLRDAESWARKYTQVHLLVDASYSMRRRRADLEFVLDRVRSRASAPVALWAVAEDRAPLDSNLETEAVVSTLGSGRFGHQSSATAFARALSGLGCERPEVRCAIVSDGQLEGIAEAGLEVPVLLLTNADEVDQAQTHGPWPAVVSHYRSGADSRGMLGSLVDPLVLPVLEVESLELGGHPLEPLGAPPLRVAEGGSLKAYARPPFAGDLRVRARIDERSLVRTLPIEDVDVDDPRADALRRGLYHSQLTVWMKQYRVEPSDELRERITEVSLREGIPTAFTSLQVDDPELSLYSVKPGDPLLRVRAEPGLQRVVAYYPFGEVHALTRDGYDFIDRFLVPRNWAERGYRIRMFKHYADGRVAEASAYYRLDDRGPEVLLSIDADRSQLLIDAGGDIGDVARVEVHAADGEVLVLTPVGGRYRVTLSRLGKHFDVFVRDRAGNRTHLPCTVKSGALRVHSRAPRRAHAHVAPDLPAHVLTAEGQGMSIDAGRLHVVAGQDARSSDATQARLHSLQRTAWLSASDGSAWFGTSNGDLVQLHACVGGQCQATPRAPAAWLAHPVTGIVELGPGHLLVAVLGHGLFEIRGDQVERSRYRVGTLRVSGLALDGEDVLIATHTRGLWRLVPRRGRWAARPVRTRFVHSHVAALQRTEEGVRIDSGFGSFRRLGRDRYQAVAPPVPAVTPTRLTATASFAGMSLVASFDRGLFALGDSQGTELSPWPTELTGLALHINALAVDGAALWVGSEGGLFRLDASGRATQHLNVAVHGLALAGDRLAVASSDGLFMLDGTGVPRRLDQQGSVPTTRFSSVAFHRGGLYAGSLDGLFRFETHGHGIARAASTRTGFDAAWVTSLASDGSHLWVGTYASGVRELTDTGLHSVAGLESQWVPPGGLSVTEAGLWVGGLGMAPALISGRGVQRVAVPSLDVYAAGCIDGQTLLLTSDGSLVVRNPVMTDERS